MFFKPGIIPNFYFLAGAEQIVCRTPPLADSERNSFDLVEMKLLNNNFKDEINFFYVIGFLFWDIEKNIIERSV